MGTCHSHLAPSGQTTQPRLLPDSVNHSVNHPLSPSSLQIQQRMGCFVLLWVERLASRLKSHLKTDTPRATPSSPVLPTHAHPPPSLPDRVRNNFWLYLSQASQPVQTFRIKFNAQTFSFPFPSTCLVQISYRIPSFVYVFLSAILHAFIFVNDFKNNLRKGEM